LTSVSRRTAPSDRHDGWTPRRRAGSTQSGPDLEDCVVFECREGRPRLAQLPDSDRVHAFERPHVLSQYASTPDHIAALPVLHQAGELEAARRAHRRVRVLPVKLVPAARVGSDLVVAAPLNRWPAERVALLAGLDVVVTVTSDEPSVAEAHLVRRLQLTAASVAVDRVVAERGRGRGARYEPIPIDELQAAHDAVVEASLLGVRRDKLPPRQPRTPDLVEGLIQSGLVLVVGPAWSGKTTIIAGLCDAVAKGRDWLGRRTQGGAVLVACGEAAEAMRDRCQAVADAHPGEGIGPAVVEVLWRLHDGSGEQAVRRLGDTLKLLPDARLLVIDTLASVTSGMPESEPAAMGLVLRRIKTLMQAHPRLTVLVIHHPLKSGEGVRGHGSLEAQADAQLEVKQSHGEVVLTLKHSRDRPSGVCHRFALKDHDGVAFARPLEGTTSPAAPGGQESGSQRQGQREALLQVAREAGGPIHRNDLMDTTGFGKTLLHELLRELPALKRVEGQKAAFYEYVPDVPEPEVTVDPTGAA
jgi:hypothetical protein